MDKELFSIDEITCMYAGISIAALAIREGTTTPEQLLQGEKAGFAILGLIAMTRHGLQESLELCKSNPDWEKLVFTVFDHFRKHFDGMMT